MNSSVFNKQENFISKKVVKVIFFTNVFLASILFLIQISIITFIYIKTDDIEVFYNIIWGFFIFVIYLVYKFVVTKIMQKNYSYTLDKDGVIIQEGVFVKSKSYIPYNIIQNVDITSNFIMRKYNFSTIKIVAINVSENIKYIDSEISKNLKAEILENKNRYKLKF